jgi:hypothetical protein
LAGTTYIADYLDELKKIGDFNFGLRYPSPVLIVQGIAGTLKDQGKALGVSTLVSTGVDDIARQGSMLIGRVFHIRKPQGAPPGPISVGRTADNDVPIPEYSISKRHCLFTFNGRETLITDCGSTNGTLLDGLPLPPKKAVTLPQEASLVLGRFAFGFRTQAGFLKLLKGQ